MLSRRSLLGYGLAAPLLGCGFAARGELFVDQSGLGDGTYIWQPAQAAEGPVFAVVSKAARLVHVYRGANILGIARCRFSDGGPACGIYAVAHDRTGLIWDGVPIVAVGTKRAGPRSSAGVRIPDSFARMLAEVAPCRHVIVADERTMPVILPANSLRLPFDALQSAGDGEPASIAVSGADQAVYGWSATRDRVRVKHTVREGKEPIGTSVHVLVDTGAGERGWLAIALIDPSRTGAGPTATEAVSWVFSDAEPASLGNLATGSIVVVTDAAIPSRDTEAAEVPLMLGMTARPAPAQRPSRRTSVRPRRERFARQSDQPLFPRLLQN